MAFNPFATFRRNQKIFMAGSVLICMLTFVLCSSGIRGSGLDDLFFSWFGRHRGEALILVNDRNYYSDQITELKNQRSIANDFMRELSQLGIKRLTAEVEQILASGAQIDDQRKFRLSICQTALQDLRRKLTRDPRFFRGGSKLDDVIEFILWRDQANKQGVYLTDDVVHSFIRANCHSDLWDYDSDAELQAQYKVRASHAGATDSAIRAALMQEYRVQIVQLAALARWSPGPGNEREIYANMQNKEGKLLGHIYLNTPMQARIAPTPEEVSAQYRKMRTELTIDLLPVSLEVLAEKVKLPSDPQAKLELLKKFYDENAKKPYNPTLDSPGFTLPTRAEIQFFTADAGMDYYKIPAAMVSVLEKTPPVAFNPLLPFMGEIGWLAAAPSWQASLQQNLDVERIPIEKKAEDQFRVLAILNKGVQEASEADKAAATRLYESKLRLSMPTYKNSASPWTTPYYYSPGQYNIALEKPTPEAVAALVGGTAGWPYPGFATYQASAYQVQAKKIAPLIKFDVTKRAIVGAELFLSHTPQFYGDGAFAAAALTYSAGVKPQFLPIAGYIEEDQRTKIEERLAQRWVNSTMLTAKAQLEAIQGRGKEAFDHQVSELRKRFSSEFTAKDGTKGTREGLRFGETPHLRSEYDVEFDESLKPLRDNFDKDRVIVNSIEGRSAKPEMLREGDFSKLFFGTERLGVGPQEPWVPKTWPPTAIVPSSEDSPLAKKSLEQRLFDTARKPVIFWKSVKRGSEPIKWEPGEPKMLSIVEKQYRMNEARANLMSEVKTIAEEVKKAQQSEGKDLSQTMRDLAQKHGTKVITLKNVAPLLENREHRPADPITFVDYVLPRETVQYPRADTIKQLLSLRGLSAPLKIDLDSLDKSGKAAGSDVAVARAKSELEELNKLNASMYSTEISKNPKAKVGQVQVLTNKPRDVYYIATVTDYTEPNPLKYMIAELLPRTAAADNTPTTFVEQTQEDYGKELFRVMVQQMRSQAGVEITDQGRKQMADEPGQ